MLFLSGRGSLDYEERAVNHLTKEDIIKALECCTANFCVGCPLYDKKPDGCINKLNSEIISFIEHQENSIEYLKKQLEIADKETQAAHKANITYICECEQNRLKSLKKLGEDIKTVITAYLYDAVPFPSVITDKIDELVNKAVGRKEKAE